jgi:hypothetical protein
MDLFQRLPLRGMETQRVSVSIYNPANDTTTTEQISANGWTQRRLPDHLASGTQCNPSRGLVFV